MSGSGSQVDGEPSSGGVDKALARTLMDASRLTAEPYGVVRDLSQLLRSGRFDWRDIARVLVGAHSLGHPDWSQEVSANAVTLALAAMGRAAKAAMAADAVALRLREVCADNAQPEAMLRGVADVLGTVLPFDVLTYTEYLPAEDGSGAMLTRARLAIDRGEAFQWPARWLRIGAEVMAWIAGDERVMALADFADAVPGADQLEASPVLGEYRRRGIRDFVVIPRIDGDLVLGVMTLARRAGSAPFRREDQDELGRFGLDRVMRLVGEGYRRKELEVATAIIGLFDVASVQGEIASRAVALMAEGFQWEYVALFRVNRSRQELQMVAQHDRIDGKLSLGCDYAQPLSGPGMGMVGKTRATGLVLRAGDVRPPVPADPDWRPPHGYVQSLKAQTSAMCVPIRLGREVEWVLDCESSQVDGFLKPDEDSIVALVRHVERTVALWFESCLNRALLNSTEQGVIVVDENGRVERLNPAARRLLGGAHKAHGREGGIVGRELARFGADEGARRLLAMTDLACSGVQVSLLGVDGQNRPALVTVREPEHTFNRRVWLIDDLSESRWVADLLSARRVVQEVSAQSRGPLMLAQALLRQARRRLSETDGDGMDEVLDRVARTIAKAEFSYELVASTLDVVREPMRAAKLGGFDIAQAIRAIEGGLPREDRAAMSLDLAPLPMVEADAERMSFALRTLILALVSACPLGSTLRIEAEASDGIVLRVSLVSVDVDQPDEMDDTVQGTLEKALGPAEAVFLAHGARCRFARSGQRFWLELAGFVVVTGAAP